MPDEYESEKLILKPLNQENIDESMVENILQFCFKENYK